jgi:uncharacterized protein (TIGR02145 family)
MKRLFTILAVILMAAGTFGQVPEKMSYQAVIRNTDEQLVKNTAIGMQISILQSSVSGTAVYVERQFPTTNDNGLVTIEIGDGTIVLGTFASIDWANGLYFIKTEIDINGGANYTITGTSQLISVPYALYAKTSENGFSGDYNDLQNKPDLTGWDENESDDFSGNYFDLNNKPLNIDEDKTDDVTITGNQTIGGNKTFSSTIIANNGINAGNKVITNIADPVNLQDAATKAYVDALKDLIYNELLDAGMNGIVKDIEGNTYKTIKIGNQVWMAENLKTTKYRNGDLIGTTTPATLDISGETTPKYQWAYDGNESNVAIYGRLYTWYAVTDSRNVCPAGWHVPIDAEWTTLKDYLTNNGYGYGGSGSDIAKSMAATSGWTTYGTVGTVGNDQASNNRSGFTALPGGYRGGSGYFDSIGYTGSWWSSSAYDATYAWHSILLYTKENAGRYYNSKELGFSIRCVRD